MLVMFLLYFVTVVTSHYVDSTLSVRSGYSVLVYKTYTHALGIQGITVDLYYLEYTKYNVYNTKLMFHLAESFLICTLTNLNMSNI